ncbi:MAG: tRNA (N6-isopentenyl adenosine(37)-C2)-methylthiotransferase MiaB [Planctomycetota bacterium]|nr:MAG: tRNA (N6-isopentenyl adenosine(37)-C2)-methylthiotransferase MiaB [Planctomycetota bacterium]
MEADISPLKVCVVPFGCQMNRADASAIQELLERRGHVPVRDEDEADAVIYVTCTVRQHAEDRAFSRLGRHARRKRDGRRVILVLAGCCAEKEARGALERLPELDIVCGTRRFHLLPELLDRVRAQGGPIVAVGLDGRPGHEGGFHWRTSPFQAFVTVMRGCDNFCSYCIVPYVRGREYSRPPDEILDEVKRLADDGVKEITFLGQNVNSYGKGLEPPCDLAELLARAGEVEGIERLKFVTSHPKDLTPELADALALPKVCPYLHLPAQSGSNRILAAMNRGYTRERYLELVEMVRERAPGAALASDFIVGFPGETEEDYLRTRELVERVRFSQVFVFKYSPRRGTAAARLPDDVPAEVKKRRNNDLLALHLEIAAEDNAKLVGSTVEVLVEGPSRRDPSRLAGRAPTERIVIVDGPPELKGEIVRVRVESATALALYGRPEEEG